MGGKEHHNRLTAEPLEVCRAQGPVASVHPPSPGHPQTEDIQHGGEAPRGGTKATVSFADVVEEGCLAGHSVPRPETEHPPGHGEGVALIALLLFPEEARLLSCEKGPHLGLLPWPQRPR